jgi:hypothetical protein
MAVKKISKTKKSSTPKTKPKSAIKKAAVKKSVKKASGARAKPKVKAAPAKPKVKAAPAKKAVKKASAVKLTEPQQKLLSAVSQSPSPGYLGNKIEVKLLAALLEKKVVKTGKKEGGFFRYMVTKLGERYTPKAALPAPPAPSVEAVPATAPAPAPSAPASAPPTS